MSNRPKRSRRGFVELPGISMKVRTDDKFLTATIWIDGKPNREVLRAPTHLIGRPGGDLHHAFADLASQIMSEALRESTGLDVKGLRRKPNYSGETS